MKRKNVWVLDCDGERTAFLREYFSDTRAQFLCGGEWKKLADFSKAPPDFLFFNPGLLPADRQRVLSQCGSARIFGLGENPFPSGRSFRLTIPLAMPSFQKEIFAGAEFPARLRILVVDDEIEICQGLREYLGFQTRPSFEVDFALNGLDGFRKIESWMPDLTILDIKMPVKSGLDLGKEVRRKYPDIRLIVLTAAISSDEILELRKAGIPVIVEKGSSGGSFPELHSLIRKQVLFS